MEVLIMNTETINTILEENGYQLTNNPKEAIYIFPNGEMIDGGFDCGSRGEDHRMIECFMDSDRYDDNFWNDVHDQLKVVRLVPETMYALIAVDQELTKEQLNIIKEAGYEIEEY
jgi:hypothetical protein